MSALYIIIAVIIFGVLIAIHEFGHFASAKLLGVRVNEFAIGMGPTLFKRQRGETLYSLRAFPIGGFCAMEGEDSESTDRRAFTNQKVWKRLIILVAGSFMNFVLGLLIVLIIYANASAFHTPQISGFMDGFELQGEQGLMTGDVIYKIDGERIYLYSDLATFLPRGNGETFDLVVLRNGQKVTLNDFPLRLKEYQYKGETVTKYGLLFENTEEATIGAKLRVSFFQSIDFVRLIRVSFQDLFSGAAGIKDLSGPVGIVELITDVGKTSDTAALAAENIAYIAAFIAVNLAVVNMLPLPALDGGRVFFLCITWVVEKVRRRRLNPKYEGYVHAAGLVFFMALMVYVTSRTFLRS
jgi:regulator of sigma E protease